MKVDLTRVHVLYPGEITSICSALHPSLGIDDMDYSSKDENLLKLELQRLWRAGYIQVTFIIVPKKGNAVYGAFNINELITQ